MQKELKQKVLRDLRSEKYSQTRGQLFRQEANTDLPAGYCCLGVMVKSCGEPFSIHDDGVMILKIGNPCRYYTYLIDPPFHLSRDQIDELIKMNDTERRNFNYIADWIEMNVSEED